MRFFIFAMSLLAVGWLLSLPAAEAQSPQEDRKVLESLQRDEEETSDEDEGEAASAEEDAVEGEAIEEVGTVGEPSEAAILDSQDSGAAASDEEGSPDEASTDAASADTPSADTASPDAAVTDEASTGEADTGTTQVDIANFSGTPDQKGRAIAEAAEDARSGYKQSTAQGRMILHDAHGNTNERSFESRILEDAREGDDEGDRGIIIFLHPPDIKNTALLTIAQKSEDDYQWLYLPALKRVKRISGNNKSGSFVGSEYTYEDLGSQDTEDYDYTWLRDEPCPDHEELTCYVLERRPRDQDSGYSRIVGWLDSEAYRTFKSDFYDRKGTLLKTMTISEHKLFKDRFWEPMSMNMVNHVNGKSTEMLWSSYDFDTLLNENDFTVRALERLQ